jgi:DNA-binding phage protein
VKVRDTPVKTSPWDPIDRLKTDEARAAYREAAQEFGDEALIAVVEADIARAIKKADAPLDENLT